MERDIKWLATILLLGLCNVGVAQQTGLTADPTLAIPTVEFGTKC